MGYFPNHQFRKPKKQHHHHQNHQNHHWHQKDLRQKFHLRRARRQ